MQKALDCVFIVQVKATTDNTLYIQEYVAWVVVRNCTTDFCTQIYLILEMPR